MTQALKSLLEELTEEVIDEVLRKFNFAQFKNLGSPNQRIEYAQQNLPEMGVGSSRAVFALSGGKVLKIAINKAGFAQNRAEYDIFRDPRTKNVVTAIYDKDATFSWLVSEIANPLRSPDQFAQLTGITFATYVDIIRGWDSSEDQSNPDAYLQQVVAKWQDRLEDIRDHSSRQIFLVTQRRVEQYQKAAQSPFVKTMMMLVSESLSVGDVARIDDPTDTTIGHYGYTADGRVVLLDYGFTREVAGSHYTPSGHAMDPSAQKQPSEEQPQQSGLAGQASQQPQQPSGPQPSREPQDSVKTARPARRA
jgi:hypothetical protein